MLAITAAHQEFVKSEAGYLLREDVLCWGDWYGPHDFFRNHRIKVADDDPERLALLLNKLFLIFPEFRSLFDYRLRVRPELAGHMSDTQRRASELYIQCPSIGPRFRIQHGQNSYVLAGEIGSDFWVNHNVTIGSNGGVPRIGDRVMVRTGAVVVGPISLGNDVMVGANAVVVENVPDGHAAYAPRTILKPRRGFRA